MDADGTRVIGNRVTSEVGVEDGDGLIGDDLLANGRFAEIGQREAGDGFAADLGVDADFGCCCEGIQAIETAPGHSGDARGASLGEVGFPQFFPRLLLRILGFNALPFLSDGGLSGFVRVAFGPVGLNDGGNG